MKKKTSNAPKAPHTRIYKGRFFPRLLVLVLGVMLLTVISVTALVEMIQSISTRLSDPTFVNPYLTIFIIFGSALILGTLITFAASGFFLRPFRSLDVAIDKVAKGDFSVRLEGDNVTQLGRLMNNFNKMAHDLSQMETFKNEFISNVSHEFKTPLANIQGYAMLLQKADITEEERNAFLSVIIDSAQKLSNMTSNILKLSKLENSEIISDISTIDLPEQVRRSILDLETSWTEKDLSLTVELEEEIFVSANEDLLSQVWINLLSNAVKFTPEGGALEITATKEEDKAVVRIKDSGIGMSEEVLSRIFDKFYQGDNSHSYEGNGLGLALSKKIVEASGGVIYAQSKVGEGSVFTVKLPLKQ